LAFAAILAEGSEVDGSRYALNFFLGYRDSLQNPEHLDFITNVVGYLFASGFSAFKTLGYPDYFDDFIWTYNNILHSKDLVVPFEIKEEMQRILDLYFKSDSA
jgi:hypothetical protein